MRLLQTSYDDNFIQTVQKWAQDIKNINTCALFHVFVPYNSRQQRQELSRVRELLAKEAPGVPVIGCSATGMILEEQMQDETIMVSLMIFEEESTKIEIMPYYARTSEMNSEWLLKHTRAIPDLKGIELITAAPYQALESFGKVIDRLSGDIEIFGGVAVGDEDASSFVFAEDLECSEDGSAVVFYSGPELAIQTNRMFGWNAIGYPLKVTKSKGPVVYELDGKPAYDVYNHYLQIKKGPNFFYDALEFPWEVQVDINTGYIRHAKSVNSDGSIVMSTNIPQGSNVRLTYGDPRRIIEHTRQTALLVRDFAPQVVWIFNCMGRKLFWGGKENVEIAEISEHLQTTGFSALGEIMRFKGTTYLNNLSIVTVAMREGPVKEVVDLDVERIQQPENLPITARLAVFINTITEELMEKNRQLNDMLYKASHDALTRLLNRGAIERIIYEFAGNKGAVTGEKWHLIMFDIDDFKLINDQCGHVEGDHILRMMAAIVSSYIGNYKNVDAGRWGGEEFMIFSHGNSAEEVKEIAETISSKIKNEIKTRWQVTISVGVTEHRPDEDVLQTINRVDELMYKAKNEGKDRVCTDL
jgi:diguanylate cyclase (GGDEF)-like protein